MEINKEQIREISVESLSQMPDYQFDEEDFEFEWEALEAKGLIGRGISFKTSKSSGSDWQLFGNGLDPTIEAIVIGIVSNLAYDLTKKAINRIEKSTPSYEEIRERIRERFGEMTEEGDAKFESAFRIIVKRIRELLQNDDDQIK